MNKILTLTLFFFHTMYADIQEIYSLKEIAPIEKETLVVLDMDQTLIIAKDSYFQSPSFLERKELIHTMKKNWSEEKWWVFKSLCGMTQDPILVEEGWDEQIAKWQEKGTPIIALTAASGEIPGALDMRLNQLKAVGIDLSKTAPNLDHVPFPHKEGIIMTGKGSLKADVISCFSHFPHIVVVDDIHDYLKWMEEARPSIQGYHYRKIEIYPKYPLDEDILLEKWKAMEHLTDTVYKESRGA